MTKYILLLFVFLFSSYSFANEVISLVQLGEEKKSVGDEIKLQVSKEDEKIVSSNILSIESNYVLPYIYIYKVNSENDMLFMDGIVTNLNEKYKPIEVDKKIIMFNITNEHIDKTKIELPEDFLFNFTNFSFSKSKLFYYLLGGVLLLLAVLVFSIKFYPKLKKKRLWQEKQRKFLHKILDCKSFEDLEFIYAERKIIMSMFTYNKNQFEALLSLIDRNQYMKNWRDEDLEKAKTLLQSLNFNKKKYSGN